MPLDAESQMLGTDHDARARKLYARFGKRAFDLVLALLLLPVLLPLIAVLFILVRCDGGPGFFGHLRVGKHGQSFRCWKLRTMVPAADIILTDVLKNDPLAALEWARVRKLSKDPRTTQLGRFLRRTSLDELPQIFNVLRGEMSFVGPRPVTAGELAFYEEDVGSYLSQTPGVTGLWQVKGRTDGCFQARVALDRNYIREMCFLVDLGLILRTAGLILLPTGR